ncbi:MAG: YggS family pyridoxal phosphate-dependent enzyme [Candidatus Omnitrophica bacterium]|nr:YggS family pyridoxal phosphate-dependent enzyme [Candidatus Omnitrophota bacterium]
MSLDTIACRVQEILKEIPPHVILVAAGKTRTPDELAKAIEGGVRAVGENYVQEGLRAFDAVGDAVKWHFIGHLQKNKVKKAVKMFDLIETVDSVKIAEEIDKRCAEIKKIMTLLIEINSGRERQKTGVFPEQAETIIREVSKLKNVKVEGLMTMGPFSGEPENARSYFARTKKLFENIKQKNIPGINMEFLSMGMTNSYRIAIEEGANIIRLGTKIFGERE